MNTDERQELALREIAVSIANLDKTFSVHSEEDKEHQRSDVKTFDEFREEIKGMRNDLKIIKDIFNAFGKGKSAIIILAIVMASIVTIGVSLKTIGEWLKKLL